MAVTKRTSLLAFLTIIFVRNHARRKGAGAPIAVDFLIQLFSFNFIVEQYFSLSFELTNFATVGSSLEEIFLATSLINPLLPPIEKIFPTPMILTGFAECTWSRCVKQAARHFVRIVISFSFNAERLT